MPISSVAAPTTFPWEKLPSDMQQEISAYLNVKTLWPLRSTCKAMQQWVDRHVPHLAVHCREGLAMLASQERFPSLRSIALVSENDIIALLPKHIQHLDLQRYGPRINETTLQHMASLPLKSLNLTNCDIDGLSLTHLLQGSSIGTMWIGNGTPISNDNYRALAQHPTLTKLTVYTNSITEKDIDVLSKSSTLIDLAIGEINVLKCRIDVGFEHNTTLQSLHITLKIPRDNPQRYVTSEVLEVSDASLSPLFRMDGKSLCLDERAAEALSNDQQIIAVSIKHCEISKIAHKTLKASNHFKKLLIPDALNNDALPKSSQASTTAASSRKRAQLVYLGEILMAEKSNKIPRFDPMHRSPHDHDQSLS